ncbi:MAG: hypothetical protein ACLQLG_00060, partial [Thermoguttaceae bacterium]
LQWIVRRSRKTAYLTYGFFGFLDVSYWLSSAERVPLGRSQKDAAIKAFVPCYLHPLTHPPVQAIAARRCWRQNGM